METNIKVACDQMDTIDPELSVDKPLDIEANETKTKSSSRSEPNDLILGDESPQSIKAIDEQETFIANSFKAQTIKGKETEYTFDTPAFIRKGRVVAPKGIQLEKDPWTIQTVFYSDGHIENNLELLATYVQEQSDTLAILSKKLEKTLFPNGPKTNLEENIKKIANRVFYGKDNFGFFRWEVHPIYLPKEFSHRVTEQKKRRKDLELKIIEFYDSLTEEQKLELADKSKKPKTKERTKPLVENKENNENEKKRKLDQKTPQIKKVKALKTPQKNLISNFFKPIAKQKTNSKNSYFNDFTIKENVKMPTLHVIPNIIKNYQIVIEPKDKISKDFEIFKSLKNKINARKFKNGFKLLQFSQDVRPAFFGLKPNFKLNPRNFLQKSEKLLYDHDSELEWEDDDGEDLVSENDEEEEPDEEEEDGWLVPHGYLSDDEGLKDDEDVKEKKIKSDPKRVFQVLEPFIVLSEDKDLDGFKMVCLFDKKTVVDEILKNELLQQIKNQPKPVKSKSFPLDLIDQLKKFVFENDKNLKSLVDLSIEYLKTFDTNFSCSKKLVEEQIKLFAVREKRNGIVKWYEKTEQWALQKENELLLKQNYVKEKNIQENLKKELELKPAKVRDARTTVLSNQVNYYESD